MLRAAFEQFEVFVAGHTRDAKPIGKSSARFEACLHRNHAAGRSQHLRCCLNSELLGRDLSLGFPPVKEMGDRDF